MPAQDLTPHLRTRLSRLERWVGIFVTLATLLVLAGLFLYIRQMAERKGWYKRKLPYFTFVDSAAGLKEGQPVKMMGFEIGQITKIEAQPPEDALYNVFVAFNVLEPYDGYLWDDSKARVVAGDFLGNRFIEVTKGSNGVATYVFHPLTEIDIDTARTHVGSGKFVFAEELLDGSKTNFLTKPGKPIDDDTLRQVEAAGIRSIQVMDKSAKSEWPTGMWVPQEGRYTNFYRGKSKGYFMPPDEQPALTERLELVANTLQEAMPNVLDLTNDLQRVLRQAANAAEEADQLLTGARPVVTNLAVITSQLTSGPGALGEWLIPTNLQGQLGFTLTNAGATLSGANVLVTNINARFGELATTLNRAIENLAGITSNLHRQVDANTNILTDVSKLIVDTDHMVQGLKRHWLLRSAFKEKKTNAPPRQSSRKAWSPKTAP